MQTRALLIGKLQDAYHYLLAATGTHDSDGRESTFDYGKLVQRIECYEKGREAFIEAHDIADGGPDGADAEQRREVLDSRYISDLKDEIDMRLNARILLGWMRQWCERIAVDPYCAYDEREERSH